MARPKTKIARRALSDYVKIALAELPPPSYVRDVLKGHKRYLDWREDALKEVQQRGDHETFATEEEYVKEIIAGKAAFTWNFVKALHTVLDLNVWGLEFEALWQNDNASDLRHDPENFRVILEEARKNKPHPFREFPALSVPLAKSWISAAGPLPANFRPDEPIPHAITQFGETLAQPKTEPLVTSAPELSFMAGAMYMLTFTARIDGRILLIGRERKTQIAYLLNTTLGLDGLGVLRAGERYRGNIWRATEQVGEWDLAVIFLNSDTVAKQPDLNSLLARATGRVGHRNEEVSSTIYNAEMARLCQLLRASEGSAPGDIQLGLHQVLICAP